MQADYSYNYLPNGIRLIFMPTVKFKTISMGVFLHQELKPDMAALNALLPSVLEQGSRLYPDYLTLQRELEKLYGADIATDIIKSGERHILAFTLETAHDKYLGEDGKLLQKGMSLLGSVLGDPLVIDDAFRQDYVKQEKSQLIKDIKAMLNDKVSYAMERCLALMCADENFGIYKLGKIEDYGKIDAAGLYRHYSDLLTHSPIDLYVIGDLDQKQVLEAAAEIFSFSRNREYYPLPETEIMRPVGEVKYVEEDMTVNQAKMVLGFRTYTGYRDVLYCPLMVYSGVLGGFPHSKLFMNVREEAGLAYYINSRLEKHKGLMVISAGINYADLQKAREIIDRQLEDMASGAITDAELDNTKQALTNQLLSRQDSPSQMISFHLEGSVAGKAYGVQELTDGIEAVDRKDIMAVAERIKLDTVYLLRPREGGSK
ncbi:MAG: EF-P 5-aminopentanol modification-associated protein YfmF [Bacillota bacterium]